MLGGQRTVITLDAPPAEGTARAAVASLITSLQPALSTPRSQTEGYLEGVFLRSQLDRISEVLAGTLGAPAKPFGQPPSFDKALKALIETHGGIMKNQCLYLRQFEDGFVSFAALWPWSDEGNITLKLGVYDEKVD